MPGANGGPTTSQRTDCPEVEAVSKAPAAKAPKQDLALMIDLLGCARPTTAWGPAAASLSNSGSLHHHESRDRRDPLVAHREQEVVPRRRVGRAGRSAHG